MRCSSHRHARRTRIPPAIPVPIRNASAECVQGRTSAVAVGGLVFSLPYLENGHASTMELVGGVVAAWLHLPRDAWTPVPQRLIPASVRTRVRSTYRPWCLRKRIRQRATMPSFGSGNARSPIPEAVRPRVKSLMLHVDPTNARRREVARGGAQVGSRPASLPGPKELQSSGEPSPHHRNPKASQPSARGGSRTPTPFGAGT